MIPFTHLTMLIAAFLGANLSGTQMDIEPKYRDPDQVARYCAARDSESNDYHNNYTREKEWYRWERCLLRDSNGNQIKYENVHRLSKEETQELVEEVWERYAPWMREQFQQTLFFPRDKDSPDGDWYRIVLPEDWTPWLPLINTGHKKVSEHCSEGAYGCGGGGSFKFRTLERLGESVWWLADNTYNGFRTYTAKLTPTIPARIVTPKRNRYVVLHELAHAINQWQYDRWERDHPPTIEHTENERTEGHGYEFRCLALDLYNNYGGDIAEIVPYWKESYAHLNRLCQIIAPGYAQSIADEESAEDEEN